MVVPGAVSGPSVATREEQQFCCVGAVLQSKRKPPRLREQRWVPVQGGLRGVDKRDSRQFYRMVQGWVPPLHRRSAADTEASALVCVRGAHRRRCQLPEHAARIWIVCAALSAARVLAAPAADASRHSRGLSFLVPREPTSVGLQV
eukprot:734625-Prymnesium_polylepis.1